MHPIPHATRRAPVLTPVRRAAGGAALVLLALSAPVPAAAQDPAAVTDVGAGWRMSRAPLTAQLGGVSLDDSGWDEVRLTAPWPEQFAPGYDGALWYRKAIRIPPGVGPVALLLGPSRYGAVQVWIDGEKTAEIGSLTRLLPYPQERLISIPAGPAADGRVEMAIRFHRVGWMSEAAGPTAGPFEGTALLGPAPALAVRAQIGRLQSRQRDFWSLVMGIACAGIGAFQLLLFARRRSARAYLWLGAGALALAAHALLIAPSVAQPIDHLALTHRLSAIAGHGAALALILFIWGVLDRPIDRWLRLYLLSHLLLAAFLAVAPFRWVWTTDPIRLLWMLPAAIGGPAAIVAALRRGQPEARALLLAAGFALLGGLAEVGAGQGWAFPAWLPLVGFAGFLSAAAFALTERFSRSHMEVALARRDLEHRLDQRTRALGDAARAGDRAHRAKSEFLSSMSHELRTPLNTVIGFANVLLRETSALDGRERHFLERIRIAGEELLGVVDDVLDYARIESGQMDVRLAPAPIGEIVRTAVQSLDAAAHHKALDLNVRIPGGLDPVRVDPTRLEQVLRQLVENAIKFTKHGGVTVAVEADGARPLALTVEDTGIGIPREQIERVFEPFQQGDTGLGRSYAGTGLGLSIARSLAQLMGCDLTVKSQPGVGSIFRLSLPIGPRRASGVSEAIAQASGEDGKLVLIIDDEADARLLLAEHVRSYGMRAVSAAGGLEGLRLARELHPDLVTLDLKMPGMDGWATLRAFKADPSLRGVPVVVVSVIAAEARGTFLGQLDLVGKPVDRDALEEAVRRNLRGRPSRALVVDDDADQRLLLTSLLERSVEEVRTAVDGVQALATLDHYEPGVILLDLVMPRMDGMTFLKALREHPRHAETPVLVVTSKELTEAETAVLDRATAGVVRKGPRGEPTTDLRARLASLLGANRSWN